MTFQYYPDTDILYIQLFNRLGTEYAELTSGILLDFDDENEVVGIEVEGASKLMDLDHVEVSALPIMTMVFSQPFAIES